MRDQLEASGGRGATPVVRAMKLTDFLLIDAIRIPLEASTKEEAIAELVRLLEQSLEIDSHGEVLSRVIARESIMSTSIGHGVAVPHGKPRSIRNLAAACGVIPGGLDYDSLDGEPVRLLLLLVSPEAERGPHVRALAAISKLVQNDAIRTALCEAPDPAAFQRRLQAAERQLELE